jgi:hypothetical protein
MATYPGGIKSFSTKTDGVSEVMSSDVNEPQDEITAVETELGIDVAGTATDLVTRLARSLSGTGNLDFATSTALTIATGSVTPTQNWHTVDTESAAASDDLDTIVATNATDGFMLFLRQSNNARDVTIKHNTGNIYCPGGVDIVLTDTTQVVAFIYDGTLSKWLAAVCPANVGLLNGANTWTAANIFSKALNFAYTSVTADTTLDGTHFFVDVDATSDSVNIPLPTVVGINGREYIIRKLDASANTVTITPDGTETINGSSDAVLDEQYETAIIFSNGASDWMLLATGGGGGSSSDLIEHTHTGSTDGGLLRLDTIAAPTDTTTRDSSTDAHGLLPKLDGVSTNFLNGTGAWSAPAGGSSDIAEHTHADSDTGGLIRLDTITAPTDSTSLNASTDLHGLLPKLSGTVTEFMNGQGAWSTPPSGSASSDLIEHGHTASTDGGLIRLDTIAAPTDSTSLDASTDAHGLLPKLNGNAYSYLTGSGVFQDIQSAAQAQAGIVLLQNTSDFIAGTTDVNSYRRIVSQDDFNTLMRSATTDFDASTDTHGFLPMLSGTSDNFLNGKGEYIAVASGGVGANLLINGGFVVSQRGTIFTSATIPANENDTYLLDRWNLLSETSDVVDVSQSTDAPTGFHNSIKLEVETANKQFGIVQILENKDSIPLIGSVASLTFQARMAAADDNTHSIKAAVLSWSSTADSVTSDVVGTWAASITPAANWTAENVAASNTLTTSWQEFKIENIAIDTASAANVAVLFYCDQTDGAVDDAIYITGVKLEKGATATAFVARPIAEELNLCMRYYEDMNAAASAYTYFLPGVIQTANNICIMVWKYTIPKRATPAISFSGQTDFQADYVAATADSTAMTADMTGAQSTRLYATITGTPASNPAFMLRANNKTAAFIAATAEL